MTLRLLLRIKLESDMLSPSFLTRCGGMESTRRERVRFAQSTCAGHNYENVECWFAMGHMVECSVSRVAFVLSNSLGVPER